MKDTSHHDSLRAWAKGTYPEEAAVELLIRAFDGRFAETNLPWIFLSDFGDWVVDWERLQESAVLTGPYSGGERRVLGICASLGWSGAKIALTDAISGLDEEHIRLILAAMSHASGVQEMRGRPKIMERGEGETGWIYPPGALYPWPKDNPLLQMTVSLQDLADLLGTDTETAAGFTGHIDWAGGTTRITPADAIGIEGIWLAQQVEGDGQ